MYVALVGGMERLRCRYVQAAGQLGLELRVFNTRETGLRSKIENVDAVVVFTNKVSHEAKKIVMNVARVREIPVFVHHSCCVCSLRDCLTCLKNNNDNRRFL
jgi:hypothetical protein